ncbi:MAG: hypothetical protein F4118_08390 [Acidimicrobiaceae bacterium]|nr:hypothetical protein [Candidatus Poribacteria bacterium]MYI36436.1 hypothetical protein [Acidimicrobiaceae bacterium]
MYEWVISETRDGLWSTTLFLGEIAVWKSTVNFQFRQQAVEQVRVLCNWVYQSFIGNDGNIEVTDDTKGCKVVLSSEVPFVEEG